MPLVIDTLAPPNKVFDQVKTQIEAGMPTKGGTFSPGSNAASVIALKLAHMVENVFVGAASFVGLGFNDKPVVQGPVGSIVDPNFARDEVIQEGIAQRNLQDTGYSIIQRLPDPPAIPLAIAPPEWAEQSNRNQNDLLVATATLALTMAVSAYIRRRRQANGKVLIEDVVVEHVKRGMEAAVRGTKDGVVAAHQAVEAAVDARFEAAAAPQPLPEMHGYSDFHVPQAGGRHRRTHRKLRNRKTRRRF